MAIVKEMTGRNREAQLAIVMQMSRQELRSTGGNCQEMTGRNRAAQLEIVKQMSRQ